MEKRKEKKTNSGEFVKYGWYKNGERVSLLRVYVELVSVVYMQWYGHLPR